MLLSFVFSLLLAATGRAAPLTHQPGEQYTVIIDPSHPLQPDISRVLDRLSLSPTHPDVHHVYNNIAFRGFHASMRSHCIEILRNMSEVAIIEPPIAVSLAVTARMQAPWGLERISTANVVNGSDSGLTYTYSYANEGLGANADVYILDTGVYTSHVAFTGRAKSAWSLDNNMKDNDGHGTHVSGIAAGAAIGVASNANIIGVKAMDLSLIHI